MILNEFFNLPQVFEKQTDEGIFGSKKPAEPFEFYLDGCDPYAVKKYLLNKFGSKGWRVAGPGAGTSRVFVAMSPELYPTANEAKWDIESNCGQQGVAEDLNEIYKMPPTKDSSQGMTIWAYNDALEKKLPVVHKDKNVIIFKSNEDLLRYIILQDGNPVLYIGFSKFLDGYKSGAVATEIQGRGKGLAQKAYINASDILGVPIYSDSTQTDASRLGIWDKLIQQYPDRIVGYDQKTNKNLPLSVGDKGPIVNQNQPIYVDRNPIDTKKPVSQNQRYRTRILKLLPIKQSVAEGVDIGQEWMSDTELDQYVPDRLQQQWRELLGYDQNGNPSALWVNLTGGYEPDVQDPQHRALMVKVANKWFAAKKIPNVKFYDVKDADDELEWLVQIGSQDVAEGLTGLSIQQLATISDEALDNAYHYGRSQPGNTFGWQANLKSAAYAKQMIDKGVTDIEAISDAIHTGWNVTAQAFVKNPDQFSDTEKLKAAGKLEAKLQQRAQLMKQNYAQLPEEEKEKDRVVARALLRAITGQQGVAEGKDDYVPPREANYDDKYQAMVRRVGEKAKRQEKARQQQPPKTPVRENRRELLKQIIQS